MAVVTKEAFLIIGHGNRLKIADVSGTVSIPVVTIWSHI
jgi:hypothetical protein